MKQKLLDKGYMPTYAFNELSYSTLINYCVLLASDPKVTIINKQIQKTQSCFTAENLLLGSICLLHTVAATLFCVAEEIDHNLEQKIFNYNNEGVKNLFHLVKKYHNNKPLRIVKPYLLFSTNDMVQYIFEGGEKEGYRFQLVGKVDKKEIGARLYYKFGNKKQ